ncbi:hypothetical protein [Paludisphaera soli]|uniref:hypothetical protein n=1 Tax=Paludisphaera soli TaxID=2712865 RepID=UPI0013ED8B51|nr:hypothetical protein [Paludisphaera soli]
MNAWVQIAVGLASSYLAATLSESFLHRTVGHAGPRLRRAWARRPRLCGHLLRAHYRHAVVHHGLTFARDHVTQFLDDEDKARVDAIIEPRGDPLIQRERYGLSVGLRGFLTYNGAVWPLIPALALGVGPWAALAALPIPLAAPLLSMFIHPYLHLPHREALRRAPRPLAFLLDTAYFRSVARHHYLHHAYPRSNFNLLLGGDRLLGTHRRPTAKDLDAMAALDIPAR